jgi:splicing factor 3B subunit 5
MVGGLSREWIANTHRDSYAAHIGHYSRLAYMAAAENESIARTRYKLLNVNR